LIQRNRENEKKWRKGMKKRKILIEESRAKDIDKQKCHPHIYTKVSPNKS
jgi:hypothetical protein